MNELNIIIYKFKILYQILKEIDKELNINFILILDLKSLNREIYNPKIDLVITRQKILNLNNQFIIDSLPIKIFKLVEKFKIELLRKQFVKKSKILINNYTINLNSREVISDGLILRLTEREIDTIIYLAKAKQPVSISKLQYDVWGYNTDIETHTVETHIYRLRQKILKTFKDNDFIMSKKEGYLIQQKN